MFIEHNNYQFKYFTEQSKDKWQLKKKIIQHVL